MKQRSKQQIHKVLKVYQHHLFKTQQALTLKKQSRDEIKKRLDEKVQAIDQIETRLADTQKRLIARGQLSQWQAYQHHSETQRALVGQLTSQKSKLEIQVAVAQLAVEETTKKIHVIKHKCGIMEKLEKSLQHEKIIRTNESDDESSAQQWQLAQPALSI